ncbi:MAG: hypothetical protein QG671_3004, partial [Actinomycetota bacterium]|nr:hypothetical protein [Actinomycetota bacterium]
NSAAVAAVAGATPTQIADAKAYMARAAKVLESIRVRADLARSQKDIIMLNCVNDKLTQASGNNQILIQRVTALHELLDEAKLAHEWTVAGIVDQKLQVLNLEANACVGVLESNIDSGGGRAEVTVDATLPNHHEVPPSVSPVIVVPPYVGKPASTGPDNLGSPSWWRPTVPAAWAAPAADPIRWTPRSVVPVRVNCPALDSQGCADELIRIQAAAQAIKNGGGPDLQVQPEPSSSKFAPHNPAAGQGHGDPAFPGGLSVTFTKPGAIKKNPDGSWVRVDGRVQLLPGELAKGYTDIFYDRTVLANGGKPNEAGVGGFDWANDGHGAKITDGYVAIDAGTLTGVPAWKIQALYMHELGHAIGLTHPDQTRTLPDGSSQAGLPSVGQIMDSTIDVPDARWGNGDLAGLAAVGGAATK